MQIMKAEWPERFSEKRHLTHKRMERWIRLQQFVYGLPDDFSYAGCTTEKNGYFESRALVNVGWMSWFGKGKGSDRQHSLAVALLDSTEAISANGTKVFFHGINRWFGHWLDAIRMAPAKPAHSEVKKERLDRLAS